MKDWDTLINPRDSSTSALDLFSRMFLHINLKIYGFFIAEEFVKRKNETRYIFIVWPRMNLSCENLLRDENNVLWCGRCPHAHIYVFLFWSNN